MTGLDTRPVVRETRALEFARSSRKPIIIRLEVGGHLLRLKRKGDRQWYSVRYETVLLFAQRAHVLEVQRQNKLAREQRRKERT